MAELAKIRRVITRQLPEQPRHVLLVLDATTGQNGLSQADAFLADAGVTGIVLAKLDGTAKGGVAVAIADRYPDPDRVQRVGEELDALAPFDPDAYLTGRMTNRSAVFDSLDSDSGHRHATARPGQADRGRPRRGAARGAAGPARSGRQLPGREVVRRPRTRAGHRDRRPRGRRPGHQVVLVHDELVEILGRERYQLHLDGSTQIVLMVGLQGSGKTTSAAKLARRLRLDGRHPALIAADVYRPAAVEQLVRLASRSAFRC